MYTIKDIYDDIVNGASFQRIHSKYGGVSIYIPQRLEGYRELIIEEFNGYNYRELAYKYNLAEYSVRRILREHKKDLL